MSEVTIEPYGDMFDRCSPAYIEPFAQNDRVILISYIDDFYDLHMRISQELYPSLTSAITENEELSAGYRRMLVEESNELKALVFEAKSKALVGEVVARLFGEGLIEVGWDVRPKYQGMGYATRAAKLFIKTLNQQRECSGFVAAVEADNAASKAVIRKLGGKPSGLRTTVLTEALGEEGRKKFQSENEELLTEELVEEAGIFGVDPAELLTHALVYSIPVPAG